MDKKIEEELYSDVMQTLIKHLQKRNDVQNIDLISRLDELINRYPNKIRFQHIRAHQKEPEDLFSDTYKVCN